MIQLSIDESVKRLKAEIIAQDWGLSEKRIELLDAAFSCLKQRFKNRKAAHAILIMAGSVLDYVKRKGENTPSDSIDFLKESMAHVVNLYEADEFEPEKEEQLFKGLYYRFNSLKEKIKSAKRQGPDQEVPSVSPRKGGDDDEVDRDTLVPESIDQLRQKVAELRHSDPDLEKGEVERLVSDLQSSLERAEYVGETIRRLLSELLSATKQKEQQGADHTERPDTISEYEDEGLEDISFEKPPVAVKHPVEENPIKNCPSTQLRKIILTDQEVYLHESFIACIRSVKNETLKMYIKNTNVPLKDFGGFFTGLAKQFKGSLSNISDKKLKKLTLPVMIPTGLNMPDMPDENGTELVFVTHGQWNGILLCSEVGKESVTMVKFKKAKNGDVAGIGFSENGDEFPLLNAVSVLRREGFLTMV